MAFLELSFVDFRSCTTSSAEGFSASAMAASTSDDVDMLDSLKLGGTCR